MAGPSLNLRRAANSAAILVMSVFEREGFKGEQKELCCEGATAIERGLMALVSEKNGIEDKRLKGVAPCRPVPAPFGAAPSRRRIR